MRKKSEADLAGEFLKNVLVNIDFSLPQIKLLKDIINKFDKDISVNENYNYNRGYIPKKFETFLENVLRLKRKIEIYKICNNLTDKINEKFMFFKVGNKDFFTENLTIIISQCENINDDILNFTNMTVFNSDDEIDKIILENYNLSDNEIAQRVCDQIGGDNIGE